MAVIRTVVRKRRQARPATTVTTVVSKGRRRRRARGMRAPRMGLTASQSAGQQYLACLLGGAGPAKIPDGDGHHSVAIEYIATQTLTPVDGYLSVLMVPGLPGSLRVTEGAGEIPCAEGGTIAITDVGLTGATVKFPEFSTAGGTAPSDARMNTVTKIRAARVVKYSMEVTQVGPVLNQGGNVATARLDNPLAHTIETPCHVNLTGANSLYQGFTFANLLGAEPVAPANLDNYDFNSVSTYPSAKLCNATEPCMLLGKGSGDWVDAHFPSEWYDNTNNQQGDTLLYGRGLHLQDTATGATGGLIQSGPQVWCPIPPNQAIGSKILVGDFWTDTRAEALIWAGSNLPAGSTFMVRATLCLEVVVSAGYNASVYRPLVTPPVGEDMRAVERADAVMKVMPPSVSKADGSQSWWNALTAGVTGVAEIVGGMGLPIASPIASVGARVLKALGMG